MKTYKILVFSICFFNLSFSQNSEIGNWFIYFGNQKINQNWNLHSEIQYRNYDFIGDTNQILVRIGIGYNLKENNNNILMYGETAYIDKNNLTITFSAGFSGKAHLN
jgi:hypothetical protein